MAKKDHPFIVTGRGKVASNNGGDLPSQEQLASLSERYRSTLQELTITSECGESNDALDFSKIGCLPALRELTLACLEVESIHFTEQNTPGLESLELENINWEGDAKFFLQLPSLVSLHADHILSDGEFNAFGDSLSRCPNLRVVHTYKFSDLAGMNFCVLPNMESLTMHRAEGMQSLEILSAPRLTELSIQASFELDNIRLWDLPAATAADALKLNQARTKSELQSSRDKVRARKAPRGSKQKALPKCEVVTINMSLDEEARAHLEGNKRVTVTGNDQDCMF